MEYDLPGGCRITELEEKVRKSQQGKRGFLLAPVILSLSKEEEYPQGNGLR